MTDATLTVTARDGTLHEFQRITGVWCWLLGGSPLDGGPVDNHGQALCDALLAACRAPQRIRDAVWALYESDRDYIDRDAVMAAIDAAKEAPRG